MKPFQNILGFHVAALILGKGVAGFDTPYGLSKLARGGSNLYHNEGAAEEESLNIETVKPKLGRSYSVGILLFPGWEPLDIIGPFEILQSLSFANKLTLSLISNQIGPVSSVTPVHTMDPSQPPLDFGFMIGVSLYATRTHLNAPALDILLVPGGMGNMALKEANNTWMEDFVARRFNQLEYLLSVCTGSVTLALAGVLEGKKATTNKASWAWVTQFGQNVKWVPSARWTVDGKIWTSSGVAAGMDMVYAFAKHLYGNESVNPIMNQIEYAPHTDADWDPFSVVHKGGLLVALSWPD